MLIRGIGGVSKKPMKGEIETDLYDYSGLIYARNGLSLFLAMMGWYFSHFDTATSIK